MSNVEPEIYELKGATLLVWREIYSQQQAANYFAQLQQQMPWQQLRLKLYGREVLTPRLVAWAGEEGLSYTYSGVSHQMAGWPPLLFEILESVQQLTNLEFNSVLLNFYRDGRDAMSWHSDDEKELGQNPAIASLSFGQPRRFLLRNKSSKEKFELLLGNADLLLMVGETQHFWQHAVPKSLKINEPRINLTFRRIFD